GRWVTRPQVEQRATLVSPRHGCELVRGREYQRRSIVVNVFVDEVDGQSLVELTVGPPTTDDEARWEVAHPVVRTIERASAPRAPCQLFRVAFCRALPLLQPVDGALCACASIGRACLADPESDRHGLVTEIVTLASKMLTTANEQRRASKL